MRIIVTFDILKKLKFKMDGISTPSSAKEWEEDWKCWYMKTIILMKRAVSFLLYHNRQVVTVKIRHKFLHYSFWFLLNNVQVRMMAMGIIFWIKPNLIYIYVMFSTSNLWWSFSRAQFRTRFLLHFILTLHLCIEQCPFGKHYVKWIAIKSNRT